MTRTDSEPEVPVAKKSRGKLSAAKAKPDDRGALKDFEDVGAPQKKGPQKKVAGKLGYATLVPHKVKG